VEAAEILLDELWLEGDEVAQDDWEDAMEELRNTEALAVEGYSASGGCSRCIESGQEISTNYSPLLSVLCSKKRTFREAHEDLLRNLRTVGGRIKRRMKRLTTARPKNLSRKRQPIRIEVAQIRRMFIRRPVVQSMKTHPKENPQIPKLHGRVPTSGRQKSALVRTRINNSPLASLDEHEITTGVDTEFDEDLLTGVGKAGFLSKGYLHERPLEAYLGTEKIRNSSSLPTNNHLNTATARFQISMGIKR